MAKNAKKVAEEAPVEPEVDSEDAARRIIKDWKQGAHIKAAEAIIEKRGSMAALIEAIPEDEKLIRETLAQRGVY